jgi:arginyl-tRNA synthetase
VTPDELSEALSAALAAAVADGTLALPAEAVPASVHVERPRQREHGDWATNVALQLAKKAGTTPRALAEDLAARLGATPGVKAVDVAGPGFLNITLDAGAAGELARTIVAAGDAYGRSDALAGQVHNLEFISANPTGPLHIGHTRWAALGDALARILRAAGADVTAEYYINDAGAQMDKFGRSVLARARGEEAPEDGYPGEYVIERAQGSSPSTRTCSTCPRRRPSSSPARPATPRSSPRSAARSTGSACTSTPGSPSAPCTSRAPSTRPSRGCASRVTCSTRTARCGCGPRTSPTTRTA